MIGPITSAHYEKVLALNEQFVQWLSPLDANKLEHMLVQSSWSRQIDEAQGVIITFTHSDDFEHKNLTWLRARYDNFLYIDRIIVASRAHGHGLAKDLYEAAVNYARIHGLSRLVCEVNTQPDNPASHAFHLKSGFHVIGHETYPQDGVSVRYYEKALSTAAKN